MTTPDFTTAVKVFVTFHVANGPIFSYADLRNREWATRAARCMPPSAKADQLRKFIAAMDPEDAEALVLVMESPGLAIVDISWDAMMRDLTTRVKIQFAPARLVNRPDMQAIPAPPAAPPKRRMRYRKVESTDE